LFTIASIFTNKAAAFEAVIAPATATRPVNRDRAVRCVWTKLWIISVNPVESSGITGAKPGIRSGEIRDKDARGRYPQIHRWKTGAGKWKTP
jgi:hypothetical protein